MNLIKIEAVINPLNFNRAKRCLYKIGVTDIRISDIIEVKGSGKYPYLQNDSEFPFKLISKMRIDLTTSEDNLALVLTAITMSLKVVKINISNNITTKVNKSIMVPSDNYLNN